MAVIQNQTAQETRLDPVALSRMITERELEPLNIFIASFLAGLNETGVLNQALTWIASKKAGRYLGQYAKIQEDAPALEQAAREANAEQALSWFLHKMKISVNTRIEIRTDGLSLRVGRTTCKLCPKGVGGAELEGTLCPVPGLVLGFLATYLAGTASIELERKNKKLLSVEPEYCVMHFELGDANQA